MKQGSTIEDIRRNCIAAGFGDYDWSDLMGDITAWVGGEKALLLGSQSASALFPNIIYNYDPSAIERYCDGYNLLDPRRTHSLTTPVGECGLGQSFVSNDSIKHTRYFADISLFGDVKDSVHGVICDDPEFGRYSISIHRGFAGEYFENEEAGRLKAVLPMLRDAMDVSRRIFKTQHNADASDQRALLLINEELKIIGLDDRAKIDALLTDVPQVSLTSKDLKVAEPRLEKAFISAVQQTIQSDHGKQSEFALGNVQFACSQPPRNLAWLSFQGDWVLLSIGRLVRSPREASAIFAATFELTPKESELLALLADGLDLRESADAARIGYETARWHLKNMCAKTGYSKSRKMILDAAAGNVSRIIFR